MLCKHFILLTSKLIWLIYLVICFYSIIKTEFNTDDIHILYIWVRKTYTGTFKLPNGFLAELSLTHRLRKEKKGNKEKRKKERKKRE